MPPLPFYLTPIAYLSTYYSADLHIRRRFSSSPFSSSPSSFLSSLKRVDGGKGGQTLETKLPATHDNLLWPFAAIKRYTECRKHNAREGFHGCFSVVAGSFRERRERNAFMDHFEECIFRKFSSFNATTHYPMINVASFMMGWNGVYSSERCRVMPAKVIFLCASGLRICSCYFRGDFGESKLRNCNFRKRSRSLMWKMILKDWI